MIGLVLALLAAAGPGGGVAASAAGPVPAQVTVRVLGKLHPASVELSAGNRVHRVSATAGGLLVDGAAVPGPFAVPEARWRVSVAGAAPRTYDGSIELRRDGREVAVVVRMALEDHVAAVVAAESGPDTPREALRALAVVARSFAASARERHRDADLCDLAHCQVMAGRGTGRHAASAREAALGTAGRILRLDSGRVAEAAFHSSCGGHTADPLQVFGGAGTGAAAVPDPACPEAAWRAGVPAEVLSRVLARGLPAGPGSDGAPRDLRLLRGTGGWVVQVSDGRSSLGGEAFARALDRELGHGRVRSARFEVRRRAGGIELLGQGNGHGVGLCQAGAALRASRGEDHAAILAHYFPLARLDDAPPVTVLGAGPPAPPWARLNRTSSR